MGIAKEKAEAEQLKGQPDVQRALKQTATHKEPTKPVVETKEKVHLVTYLLFLAGLSGIYYLLRLHLFDFAAKYAPLLQRLTTGAMLIVLVLGLAKAVEVYLIGRIEQAVSRYNLKRIFRLLVGLILTFIAVSILFANWYTAVVSVGLVSLILGFALQTPITSFIGWIYILVREPYRVGDRIQIGDATGDVIDVSYLDTTLWEFGGKYISGDHPSGRLIKFPNEKVLDELIYNYSWPLFPYIWNEVKFQVAYNADLEFVASTMQKVTEEELGREMIERVEIYRDLLARTPVDELEVRSRPRVIFRVDEVTWINAIVRYLVSPREAGSVKTRLIPKLLAALNAEPDKVMFPAGANR